MNEVLSSLTDTEVLSQLSALVKTEKEITEKVVRHFAEVERRRLYLELGYGNLFDYATRGLGYSNAAAMRRISAARAGIQAPEVFECLEKGELNLSTIAKLAPLLKKHESSSLVERFKGKTAQEAEVMAALLNPVSKNEIRDRIKVLSMKGLEQDPRQGTLMPGNKNTDEATWFRSEVNSEESLKEDGKEKLPGEKMYHISFAADEDFMRQLERAKELLFQGNREDLALENVFGKALGEFLKRRCPKEREARRRARREKRAGKAETAAIETPQEPKKNAPVSVEQEAKHESDSLTIAESPSRYIPAAMRDEVLSRDGFCCTYTSPEGQRCSSRKNLELDHRVPFALGGETSPENLRTLCAAHNLHAAYQVLGRKLMDICLRR